jgi:hypothetical protein
MKTGVTKTKSMASVLDKRIRELADSEVLVGVPREGSQRQGAISNAALAYIHDNGAPEAGIPPRPFMKPGIKDASEKIKAHMKQAGQAALHGRAEAVERAFHAVGLTAVSSIQAVIRARIPPLLAESTLAARRRRGRTGDVPLIDTGALIAALTYVIRRKRREAR